MTDFSRRHFFKTASLPLGLTGVASLATATTAATPAPAAAPAADPAALRWLDGSAPELMLGATLGLPWPRGTQNKGQDFHAVDAQGRTLPLQTWPLAYWPDGSLKWTAHALPAGIAAGTAPQIRAGKAAPAGGPQLRVKEQPDFIEVDTGVIRAPAAAQRRAAHQPDRARRPRDPARRHAGGADR